MKPKIYKHKNLTTSFIGNENCWQTHTRRRKNESAKACFIG